MKKEHSWKFVIGMIMGLSLFMVVAATAPQIFERIKVKDAILADNFYKVDGSFGFYTADVATAISGTSTATSSNTANTIVKRGASGEFSAGTITAALTGNVTGNVSGSSGSCTGNAATATTATSATNSAVTDDTATNATMYLLWVTANTGNLPLKLSSSKLYFNPSSGLLTATGFSGPLTGNVTGNASGSAGSCTGNSATATKSTNLAGGNSTTLLGSLPYQSNTDTTTLLSPNTTVTKKYLSMTGDGTNGAAPVWEDAPVKATGAEIITATDDAKFATPKAINDAGLSRWSFIPATCYTATPASTSTLTMVSDLTGTLKAGLPVRYTIGGTAYIGQITAIASNLLTIRGASLGGDATELEYGTPDMIDHVKLFVSGTYGNGTDTDLMYNDMKTKVTWDGPKAYCVYFSVMHAGVDTGTEPKVNLLINGQRVSTTDTNLGIQLTTAGTIVANSAVAINTSYYDVNMDELITVECTAAGGTGDAENLTVNAVFIKE